MTLAQPDLFPDHPVKPKPEPVSFEKDILPKFEKSQPDWLSRAREVAAELGKHGDRVTIDDVRERLPPPEGVDPRVNGAVFTRKAWARVGFVTSGRGTCHHRPIGVFQLRAVLS